MRFWKKTKKDPYRKTLVYPYSGMVAYSPPSFLRDRLYEGIVKIADGWLKSLSLQRS